MSADGLKGFLLKKGGGKALDKKHRMVNKWHKRWFVMAPGATTLQYYKSVTDKEALGEIESGDTGCRVSKYRRMQFYDDRFPADAQSLGTAEAEPSTGVPQEEEEECLAGLDHAEQGQGPSSDEDDNAAALPPVQRVQPVSSVRAEMVLEIPGLGKTKWHKKRPDEIEVTCNAHSDEGCKKRKTIRRLPLSLERWRECRRRYLLKPTLTMFRASARTWPRSPTSINT